MSFFGNLDPSGNNFLGMGPTLGRIMAGIGTAGGSEFHRTDGFGTQPGSWENHFNRGMGGAGPGAVGGFVTGGVPGAIVGGVGGGIAGGTGATNSTTLSGFGENLGIGTGGGLLGGSAAGTGLFSGGGAGAGAGGMSAYMPTSTPVMGQAGSTLGGGMGSSLNLAPSAMGSMGAAPGVAATPAASSPSWMKALQQIRSPQSGAQGQAAPQQNQLEMIYKMFPGLRPGSPIGQRPQIGGM